MLGKATGEVADPDAAHATIAPYGPFAAADGQVLLAIQHEREWRRLCGDVLGRSELADQLNWFKPGNSSA